MLVVIQAVMFGMGTQMSLKDFTGMSSSSPPRACLVGMLCHFSIDAAGWDFAPTKMFNVFPQASCRGHYPHRIHIQRAGIERDGLYREGPTLPCR